MNISAVIVTRGDCSIAPIRSALQDFDEVIVWDNSLAPGDLKVYGRYAGAFTARNDVIYTQDDDCIVPAARIIRDHVLSNDRTAIMCNVPADHQAEYQNTGITLVGWGTVFTKPAMDVFRLYLNQYPQDELFLRECDRVFTYLNRKHVRLVDYGVQHVPYAYDGDRMGRESRHVSDLHEIRGNLAGLLRV